MCLNCVSQFQIVFVTCTHQWIFLFLSNLVQQFWGMVCFVLKSPVLVWSHEAALEWESNAIAWLALHCVIQPTPVLWMEDPFQIMTHYFWLSFFGDAHEWICRCWETQRKVCNLRGLYLKGHRGGRQSSESSSTKSCLHVHRFVSHASFWLSFISFFKQKIHHVKRERCGHMDAFCKK